MRELESLLPNIEPPEGGLARLQRSVTFARRPAHSPSWRAAWAIAASVAVAALAIWTPRWVSERQQVAVFTAAMRQGLSPQLHGDGIRVANGAAIAFPSGDANVRLYLVQSARPRADMLPRLRRGNTLRN